MTTLRHAFRQLVRHPSLSIAVIVMLALGIGATTAIFSLFHEILVQPLPVPEPERLVNLGAPGPHGGSNSCSQAGDCEQIFSYPMFRDLEARQTVFAGLAAQRDFAASLSTEHRAAAAGGLMVSGSYFSVLSLQPALGRLIGLQDEPRVGESLVAVLSYDYWQGGFGGDRSVIGRELTVNGQRLTVIGVAPQGFTGTIVGFRPRVFVPITLRWLMEPTRRHDEHDRLSYWVYLFARLKPGTSMEQASDDINRLYAGIVNEVEAPLAASLPADVLARFKAKRITLTAGAHGQGQLPDQSRDPLTLLLGLTTLVLLIVCVNVANLLLAHGVSRTGEMAIRVTLGATRRQLVSQLLVEAALPAIAGGLLSLAVAAATLRAIAAVLPGQIASGLNALLGSGGLLFAAVVTSATVLLFGAAPAIRVVRTEFGLAGKGQSSQTLGGSGMTRFRAVSVTAQIALSMTLLVLAGLFARSLFNLTHVDLGMDVARIVTFTVSPRAIGRTPEQATQTFDRIEERLAAAPGVLSVGASRIAPLTGRYWGSLVRIQRRERDPSADIRSSTNEVSSHFFETLSMPFLRGRSFTTADNETARRVAVVNESFVHKFGLGDDPLGTRFGIGGVAKDIEIVGVVADAKYADVKDDVPAQVFLPRLQYPNLDALSFYVRGNVAAKALERTITGVVSSVDPNLPVSDLKTMERQVHDNTFFDRLTTMLSVCFAGLATLLAAVGVYGVLAYNVALRTRELGLRLALGATPAQLRALVLKQIGVLALVGATLGMAAAIGLGRVAAAMLFGLSSYAPSVLGAAATVLASVVLIASYLPARRAARIEPMDALRHD